MNDIFLVSFWTNVFMGAEDATFLAEVLVRTVIMFLIIIVGLRFLGKRGVKQLSVFELVVIIGLGSAAGDPMFYKDVGILSSLLVFIIIIALYAVLTYILGKSKKFENYLEGKPVCLIQDGIFAVDNFRKENLGSDEFFSELRLKGVSHLGQIETAIEETSGDISVFFFKDEEVRYGLPVMPHTLDHPLKHVDERDYYSCVFCGFTEEKTNGPAGTCKNCGRKHWVKASNKVRIT
ncbi:DUF421 domain-containing protein [Chryseobacterium sp.]|uniref:DUF421 domain-containing protein n=1 Tax=Chryseobacterium sp. TaxID=1871047 RepID=UPI0011CA866D|nr:DUF421 domain-containing protein [Chryseobacterium sp.]TXF77543.1 DUF421 domain-containing protein [Chryseobacterium sp.]